MIRFALTIATSIFFVVDVAAQISLDDYRREVLDYSQSLHIGQTNRDAAEAEVRRSAASMLPALGVDANFDVAFGDVGGERRWSWGIRPEIRQTLYGGGGARAGFKQAIAEYEVAVEVQEEIQEQQEEPQSSWQEQYYLGLWLGVLALLVIGLVFAIAALIRRLYHRKNRNGGRYLRKKEQGES